MRASARPAWCAKTVLRADREVAWDRVRQTQANLRKRVGKSGRAATKSRRSLETSNYQRWYRPNDGRYLSPDPIGLAGGEPGYFGYGGANPSANSDPSGEYICHLPRDPDGWTDCPSGPRSARLNDLVACPKGDAACVLANTAFPVPWWVGGLVPMPPRRPRSPWNLGICEPRVERQHQCSQQPVHYMLIDDSGICAIFADGLFNNYIDAAMAGLFMALVVVMLAFGFAAIRADRCGIAANLKAARHRPSN